MSTPKRTFGVLRWCAGVLAWMVLLSVAALLVAAVAVPRLAGATPYAVLTDSMSPRYPAGSLLIIRSTPPERIGLGQVITYQLVSGRPDVVTHRVTSMIMNARGEYVVRTKGDANATGDPDPVRPVQVRGSLWYDIPYLGWGIAWLAGPMRTVLIGVLAFGLVAYALAMFLQAGRGRRRPTISAQASR